MLFAQTTRSGRSSSSSLSKQSPTGYRASGFRLRTRERALDALLALQHIPPAVARLLEALRRVRDPEVEGMGARELLPRQRHRYRRAGSASGRIGDVQRLAA